MVAVQRSTTQTYRDTWACDAQGARWWERRQEQGARCTLRQRRGEPPRAGREARAAVPCGGSHHRAAQARRCRSDGHTRATSEHPRRAHFPGGGGRRVGGRQLHTRATALPTCLPACLLPVRQLGGPADGRLTAAARRPPVSACARGGLCRSGGRDGGVAATGRESGEVSGATRPGDQQLRGSAAHLAIQVA